MFKKEPDPRQQTCISLQARLSATLTSRMATGADALMSEQEADFLADHLADDLMVLRPSVPPENWLPDEG